MLILPAIDLKGGKCVRLLRGEMNAETVYGNDPVAVGRRWVSEGAQYLHVVDLDGAVSGEAVNGAAITALCAALPIPIEIGGGVRSVARAAELLERGADRVIFGTAALAHPEVVRVTLERGMVERHRAHEVADAIPRFSGAPRRHTDQVGLERLSHHLRLRDLPLLRALFQCRREFTVDAECKLIVFHVMQCNT